LALNLSTLYRQLDQIRSEDQISWRRFASAHGFYPSLFTRIKQGKGISARHLLDLILTFDLNHRHISEDH